MKQYLLETITISEIQEAPSRGLFANKNTNENYKFLYKYNSLNKEFSKIWEKSNENKYREILIMGMQKRDTKLINVFNRLINCKSNIEEEKFFQKYPVDSEFVPHKIYFIEIVREYLEFDEDNSAILYIELED